MNEPATPKRQRGRPKAGGDQAVCEQSLLRAVFEMFAVTGYEGTTLRTMADAVGVSHNLLNVRFGTKAELWKSAVDARVAQSGSPLLEILETPGLDDRERLEKFVMMLCHWALTESDFAALSYIEGRRRTWRNDYLIDAYIRPIVQSLETLLSRVMERPVSAIALLSIVIHGIGFYGSSAPVLERLGKHEELETGYMHREAERLSSFLLHSLLSAV